MGSGEWEEEAQNFPPLLPIPHFLLLTPFLSTGIFIIIQGLLYGSEAEDDAGRYS